uniref:VP1 n=13 Tax=Bocaparvovirus TaxID=1507401 RepID=A0A513PZ25_9VIRU|nr:VP1 [Porcine bocavirus]QBA84249.1 MAG: VP1 [Porcine bocavirus 1]BAU68099.1 VP1 [Bocaparvovirus ungulate3]QBA84294.1 MAG: VP1 [Porcine bocavirus 1]QBA84344.1 MAG: VP1 [Porcine bocavirus 1]
MNQLFPVVRSKKNDGKRGHGKKAEKRPSELKDPEKPTGELELVGERSNCSKTQRHFYFARQNQGAKRAKMSAQGGENIEEVEVDTGAGSGRSGGGGGGGGGGGSTNGGIGMATGGWVGGTYFGKNKIVTNITRQWYVPIYNGHKYTKQTETDNTNFWNGIRTPWGYINMNSYSCHFSPNDWQRLLNNYKRWKPKKMRLQLYNLQIKQVVQLGTDTLYNNDLTAGVHIMYDGSHQYPYSQSGWDSELIPELPGMIYKLPNYCYFQELGDIGDTGSDLRESWLGTACPLFFLESSSHEVLRTGEETGFEFDFDCGWVHNDRAFCPPQCDFNPLIKTRRSRIIMGSSGNTSEPYYDYKKPSNWMPGPGTRLNGHQSGSNLKTSSGPFNTSWAPPGVTQGSDTTYLNSPAMNQSQWASKSMPTAPANAACSQVDPNSLAFNEPTQLGQQGDTNIRYNNISNDLTRWGTVWSQSQQVYTSQPTQTRLDTVWQYPMQAWNGQEVTRYAPIWDKQPNTDYHTTLSSSDGTLPMKHPPGNIFIKVAKIPIPTETNTDSYLNIYCTGQISIEIEWDAEEYETKNWRPELRITSSNIGRGVYNINAAGEYNTTGSQLSNMPTRFGMNRIN